MVEWESYYLSRWQSWLMRARWWLGRTSGKMRCRVCEEKLEDFWIEVGPGEVAAEGYYCYTHALEVAERQEDRSLLETLERARLEWSAGRR